MYDYKARVLRVIDGDTAILAVDLGFSLTATLAFRVYGVDCPETHGKTRPAGLAAMARTEELIGGKDVVIRSYRPDGPVAWPIEAEKFGRWLARVEVGGIDLASELIAGGFATHYFGGKRV